MGSALIAKLMFCAMISLWRRSALPLIVETISPLTSPRAFESGPPLFPGWIGTEICIRCRSSFMPERALMVPSLYFASLLSKPASGWPTVKTFSPDFDFAEETKGGGFLKVALLKRDLRRRTATSRSAS